MRFNISFSIRTLIIGALVIIIASFAAVAWAQSNSNDPEGGRTSPIDFSSNPENLELQATSAVPVPVNPDPEGDTTPPNLAAPDHLDETELPQAPDTPSAVATLFKFIAGSNFHPREATTTHSYGNAGCLYKTSTSGYLVSDLQLPQGAEIDLVSLYFNDTNANYNAEVWLYAYDGLGGFTEIAHVASIGSPGQNFANSALISHIVDNSTESLGLVVGTGSANDSSVRICGVRVRYNVDVPGYVMLPAVMKDYVGK
jgi:hypothetical protein